MKTKWRLAKLPTPDDLRALVAEKIITVEEAREILISQETEEDRDKKSLQDEILFLRQLVQSLAAKGTIVQTIRTLPNEIMPWQVQPWYKPYGQWVNAVGTQTVGSNTANTLYMSGTGTSSLNSLSAVSGSIGASVTAASSSAPSFTAIKTF